MVEMIYCQVIYIIHVIFCTRTRMSESPTAKRKRLLDDMLMGPPVDDMSHGFGDDKQKIPVSYEEITSMRHIECFACKNITPAALRENEYYFNMMKLYTDNSTSICKDACFLLVKEYYDRFILPLTNIDWTLAAIKEHFQRHTRYPTDEVLRQMTIAESVRSVLIEQLAEKTDDGKTTVNMNNVKLVLALNKELRTLRNLKAELPNMVGYDQNLNY